MAVRLVSQVASGSLADWVAAERRTGPRLLRSGPTGLRFAFYGRISTTDHQDRNSSQHWQLCAATELSLDADASSAGTSTPAYPGEPHGRTGPRPHVC